MRQDLPDFDDVLDALLTMPPMSLALTGFEAFMLISHLQLALRHPGNKGPCAEMATQLVRTLQHLLSEHDPCIGVVIEASWHPEFDDGGSTGSP